MLEIQDLSIRYRTPGGEIEALSSINLSARKGATLALVGESGSGKSTIAMAAMGLLPSEAKVVSGRVLLEGEDILAMPASEQRRLRGTRVSLVFQDPFSVLNPSLRIGEQVGEGLVYHRGFSRAQATARAIELLDEVGIVNPTAIANAYPHELSGGMRQRALIAGALASEPEILILDEPTTALDVTIEAQILDLLEDLRDKRGLTMLFISHNLGVVRRIADEVAVLYAGQVVEHGATDDLLRSPMHPYTKGLLAAIPRLGQKKRALAAIPGRLPDLRRPPTGCRFQSRCPFATPDSSSPQELIRLDDRSVRCSSAQRLRETPWVTEAVQQAETGVKPRPASETIVRVENLSMTFYLGNAPSILRGLTKSRVVELKAVDDISLTVSTGEVVGLVGEFGLGQNNVRPDHSAPDRADGGYDRNRR